MPPDTLPTGRWCSRDGTQVSLCLRSSCRKIPVWVRLYGLPLEYWTPGVLSHLASAVGRPLLYADSMTASRRRISYARILCWNRCFAESDQGFWFVGGARGPHDGLCLVWFLICFFNCSCRTFRISRRGTGSGNKLHTKNYSSNHHSIVFLSLQHKPKQQTSAYGSSSWGTCL